jgi:hypothetical protein
LAEIRLESVAGRRELRKSRRRGSRALAVGILALGMLGLGACVAAPTAQDRFAVGFRSPEQCFASFQTAVRADDLGLERRCLSARFIGENGLSELGFRTFWEELTRKQPFLRKGIVDAQASSPIEVRGDRARLRLASHGRKLVVDLAREDFCEAWGGDQKLADESAPFRERSGIQPGSDGTRWFYGRMPLPAGVDETRVTELRLGREWKIDGFALEQDEKPGRADGSP